MSTPTTKTKIVGRLEELERTQAWLARRLRVAPQSIGIWVRGEEPCPVARQAQIVLTVGGRTSDYFGKDGYAL